MQTAPVSNPANLVAPNAAGPKAADNDTGTPFGAVLSKEVADRKAAAAVDTPDPVRPAATAKRAGVPGKPQADAAKEAEQDAAASDAAAIDGMTPADMLALVASMNPAPAAAPAKEVKPAEQTDAAAAAAIADPAAASAAAAAVAAVAATAPAPQSELPSAKAAAAADETKTAVTALDARPDGKAGIAAAAAATSARTPAGTPTVPTEARNATQQPDNAAVPRAKIAAGENAPPRDNIDDAPRDDAPALKEAPFKAIADEAPKAKDEKLAAAAQKTDFAAEVRQAAASIQAANTHAQQPAAVHAQAAAAVHADHIAPQVGTPAWDRAVGQKITWMVAGEQQTASLTLNPPDLGPLQVVLNVSNAQADATFTAAQPEVRQALEAAMPRLREMLGEAGIQLGQATVNSGNPNQQNAPEQQRSQSAGRAAVDDAPADTVVRTAHVKPAQSGRGLVDTFA